MDGHDPKEDYEKEEEEEKGEDTSSFRVRPCRVLCFCVTTNIIICSACKFS